MVPLRPSNFFFLILMVVIGPILLGALIAHGIVLEQVHRLKRRLQRDRSSEEERPWDVQTVRNQHAAMPARDRRSRQSAHRERRGEIKVLF